MPDAVLIFTGVVVFAQMFDVGLRFRPGSGVALLRDTWLLLRSFASVLIVVPLAVFVLLSLMPLPTEVAIGLVILAAAPGAPLTTRRSEAAGADRDYVSALQLMLAALAMIHMPLTFAAFDGMLGLRATPIAPDDIARQVATVTFLPLSLGWLFARAAPNFLRRRSMLLSRLSKLLFIAFILVLVLALGLVSDLRDKLMIGWVAAAAVIALAAIALTSGHVFGGPQTDRRAGLAIATVARNLGLALYVAESSEITVEANPTLLTYAAVGIVLAMPYSRLMKRRGNAAGPDPTVGSG